MARRWSTRSSRRRAACTSGSRLSPPAVARCSMATTARMATLRSAGVGVVEVGHQRAAAPRGRPAGPAPRGPGRASSSSSSSASRAGAARASPISPSAWIAGYCSQGSSRSASTSGEHRVAGRRSGPGWPPRRGARSRRGRARAAMRGATARASRSAPSITAAKLRTSSSGSRRRRQQRRHRGPPQLDVDLHGRVAQRPRSRRRAAPPRARAQEVDGERRPGRRPRPGARASSRRPRRAGAARSPPACPSGASSSTTRAAHATPRRRAARGPLSRCRVMPSPATAPGRRR